MLERRYNVAKRERILVIGVGGGGGNILNRIIESGFEGFEFVDMNRDHWALEHNKAPIRILLGEKLFRGLVEGQDPMIGAEAADASLERIRESLDNADMVFLVTGMGGGMGMGGTPIIAKAAREKGILTAAVVTMPFKFEGKRRAQTAKMGLAPLLENVDILIPLENDRFLDFAGGTTSGKDAFEMSNIGVYQVIRGITDILWANGNIKADFEDLKTIMKNAGLAAAGVGEGQGDGRAEKAAKAALEFSLVSVPLKNARSLLIGITTGPDAVLAEILNAVEIVHGAADNDASLIWTNSIDENMKDEARVAFIATGFPNSPLDAEPPALR
jgi:cell division protein FtsZ